MECLHGNFMIVSKNEKEIKKKDGTLDGSYFEVGLSDGRTVITLTAGGENPLVKADMFKTYSMGFDFSDKKLKCTSVAAEPPKGEPRK